MKRGATIFLTLLLIAAVICCALLWLGDRGPTFKGRRTADWVEQALREEPPSEALDAVVQIGAPAVPFIARQGLRNKCHSLYFLSDDYVAAFGMRYPWLYRCLRILPWLSYDACAVRHGQACWLLHSLGTNAQAAIPDVIDCVKNCRGLRYVPERDLIDTLGEISGTNRAAIPYLTQCARRDSSLTLRAAATAYYIDGRTNLFVEVCERLARKNPEALLGTQELFWFREDHELNEHLVPLLEKLYWDPRLPSRSQESAWFELEYRTNDAAAAMARVLARQTNTPGS